MRLHAQMVPTIVYVCKDMNNNTDINLCFYCLKIHILFGGFMVEIL